MKKKKLLIAGICLILVLAVIFVPPLMLSGGVHNAFDEVYYSFTQPLWPRYTYCDVWGMDVWHQETNPQETMLYYDEEHIDFPYVMRIFTTSYRKNDEIKRLFFELAVPLSDAKEHDVLVIPLLYLPDTQELIYRNIKLGAQSHYHYNPDILYDEHTFFDIVDPAFIAPILEQNKVTREDIAAYQRYLLYERFLPDWFAANGAPSKFFMDDLGTFTVVDETYSQLGEDWGK